MRMSGLSAAVFGRVDEVERLRDLVRGAMSGRGAAVLVEGEPGIGKTTLLNALAAESERLGARVLRGAATEPECRLPFAAIGSCLAASVRAGDPQSARVAALLTGEGRTLAAAGAADREFVVAEAILDLVDRWCTEGPVTLLMDDLQWADASSLLVLNRLGRAISQAPLLVAAACRRMPRAEELDGLLRSLDARGAVSLTLGPMDEPAVAALVDRLLGARPGERLLDLVGGAAGNPLYVTELVDALSRAGRIRVAGGVATVLDEPGGDATGNGRPVLPESLVGAIGRRLEFLSDPALEVLRVAAALGPGLNITELSTVLGTPVIALWEAVIEAVRAGLLTESGDELVFRHELIRQALADQLPPEERAVLQTRAGRALAAAGAPAERVAQYLLAGGDLDEGAVDWLAQAAEQLLIRAPDMAVDLLERALPAAGTERPRGDPLPRLHRAVPAASRPGRPGRRRGRPGADRRRGQHRCVRYGLRAVHQGRRAAHGTAPRGGVGTRRPGARGVGYRGDPARPPVGPAGGARVLPAGTGPVGGGGPGVRGGHAAARAWRPGVPDLVLHGPRPGAVPRRPVGRRVGRDPGGARRRRPAGHGGRVAQPGRAHRHAPRRLRDVRRPRVAAGHQPGRAVLGLSAVVGAGPGVGERGPARAGPAGADRVLGAGRRAASAPHQAHLPLPGDRPAGRDGRRRRARRPDRRRRGHARRAGPDTERLRRRPPVPGRGRPGRRTAARVRRRVPGGRPPALRGLCV